MKKPTSQPYLNRIGANIRDARLKAGLSQAQLSAKLELIPVYICRGFLSRIENGSRVLTDIEIEAIARGVAGSPRTICSDGTNRERNPTGTQKRSAFGTSVHRIRWLRGLHLLEVPVTRAVCSRYETGERNIPVRTFVALHILYRRGCDASA